MPFGNTVREKVPVLLREATFRRFWTAQTISYLGDQVTMIALPLTAVLALDASPAEIGVLTAMSTVPNLVLSLHAGVLVDRFGRRRVTMIAADATRAVLIATVPIAFVLGVLSLAQLYVVALLVGVAAVLFNVSSYSLFSALVPRDKVVQGMALTRGSFSFSWTAGPALGGLLVQALSGPIALVLDVVSFIGSALMLRSFSAAEPEPDRVTRPDALGGLRFVRGTPALLGRFVASGGLNFFYTIYFTLLFLYAADELKLSAGLIGLALSLGAVGALAGSLVATRCSDRFGIGPTLVIGSLIFPGALALMPLAHGSEWIVFTCFVVAEFASGAGLMLCDVAGSALQQLITPNAFRARVQGAYLALVNGVRTVGALAAGALGTWIGLRGALWIAVVGGVVSVVPLLTARVLSVRTVPESTD